MGHQTSYNGNCDLGNNRELRTTWEFGTSSLLLWALLNVLDVILLRTQNTHSTVLFVTIVFTVLTSWQSRYGEAYPALWSKNKPCDFAGAERSSRTGLSMFWSGYLRRYGPVLLELPLNGFPKVSLRTSCGLGRAACRENVSCLFPIRTHIDAAMISPCEKVRFGDV